MFLEPAPGNVMSYSMQLMANYTICILERCKQLTVITGRGSHSRGGVAKLRPSVIDYLNKNKYR